MKAILYKPTGGTTTHEPETGRKFALDELCGLIGCKRVELITCPDGSTLWFDEEGRLSNPRKERNMPAEQAARRSGARPIGGLLGNVLHVPAKREERPAPGPITALDVALALTRSNRTVGANYGKMRSGDLESAEERADNLLNANGGKHAYVRLGDPHEWGGEGAAATIYMEPYSHRDDDCLCPRLYESPSVESMRAPYGYYISITNGGIASVYPL